MGVKKIGFKSVKLDNLGVNFWEWGLKPWRNKAESRGNLAI